MYLSVPLIHDLPTGLFNHPVDKANHRLAGWKIRSLSKVVRLILLKSTMSALLVYSMQTIVVPTTTLISLERICQKKFWGASADQRRLYTIAWEKICRLVAVDGLGLPNLKEMNEALLAKLLWKLIANLDSLSSSILWQKYGGWRGIVQERTVSRES